MPDRYGTPWSRRIRYRSGSVPADAAGRVSSVGCVLLRRRPSPLRSMDSAGTMLPNEAENPGDSATVGPIRSRSEPLACRCPPGSSSAPDPVNGTAGSGDVSVSAACVPEQKRQRSGAVVSFLIVRLVGAACLNAMTRNGSQSGVGCSASLRHGFRPGDPIAMARSCWS